MKALLPAILLAGLTLAAAEARNLTPGATVRMSTTFPAGHRTDAGVTIDGNLTDETNSSGVNRSSTTVNDPDPWIEILLERDAYIAEVEIVNISSDFGSHFRGYLRDITIEVKNAAGTVIATSAVLNPRPASPLAPANYPTPLSLSHTFDLDQPARSVRLSRDPDPAFPNQGNGHQFYAREIYVRGEFVDPLPIRPFSVSFDSRRENPNPASQRFQTFENVLGYDVSPLDGFIDDGSTDGNSPNVGFVIDGTETVWQTHDRLSADNRDSPWNRQQFSDDDLRSLFELGWSFTAEVKAFPTVGQSLGTRTTAGFTGWGYTADSNPGWATTGAPRAGFDFGRTGDSDPGGQNRFWVRPSSDTAITVFPVADSADDYHVIEAIGLPGSTDYTWSIDGVPMGTASFISGGGLAAFGARGTLVFGSGSTIPHRTANWKNVTLSAAPGLDASTIDTGLRFYLPFDRDGFLVERSSPPLRKPLITDAATDQTAPSVGVVGQGATFPGAAQLDTGDAMASLSDFAAATLSLWIKPELNANLRIPFDFSGSGTDTAALTYALDSGDDAVIGFVTDVGGSAGTSIAAPDAFDGGWHHIALAVDTDGGKIFFDGNQIGTTGSDFLNADLDTLRIGLGESGSLDEIAIWDRALTEAEVLTAYQLGKLCAPLTLDRDGDGLNRAEELALGTSDTDLDSDGDGLEDNVEARTGTDAAMADTDGDTIDDGLETTNNALMADTDGDGSNDGADPDPADASVFPAPVLPPVPSPTADADGDGTDDFSEVLVGTDPASSASKPDISNAAPIPTALAAISTARAANGDVTFTFSAEGTVENLRIQSSADLQTFTEVSGAAITSAGNGSYSAIIPTAGDRLFFRAMGDSPDGEVSSLVTNLALPTNAEGQPQTTVIVTEGDTHLQEVQFSAPYIGYLSYTVAGLAPDGSLLPPVEHSLFIDNATSAFIPLHIFNDLVPGSQARYTIGLTNTSGLAAGIDSTVTIIVEEDDEIWDGAISIGEELVTIVLESYTDGALAIQQLTAPTPSSLLPKGTFPVTASFDFAAAPSTFALSAANIPLARRSTAISVPHATITCLELQATDAPNATGSDPLYDPGAETVLSTRISGELTALHLKPASTATAATYSGSFNLIKRPQLAPSIDLYLESGSD